MFFIFEIEKSSFETYSLRRLRVAAPHRTGENWPELNRTGMRKFDYNEENHNGECAVCWRSSPEAEGTERGRKWPAEERWPFLSGAEQERPVP